MGCKTANGEPFTLNMATACVGKGWYNLVKEAYDACSRYNVTILQVKEKFGGLRIYISGGNTTTDEIIDLVERISLKTCENCGNPGKPRGGGWIRTLCDNCGGNSEQN